MITFSLLHSDGYLLPRDNSDTYVKSCNYAKRLSYSSSNDSIEFTCNLVLASIRESDCCNLAYIVLMHFNLQLRSLKNKENILQICFVNFFSI